MLSKQIEKAQKKVEDQHYLMRKHTLEYDVMLNQQREVIYTYRDEVLEGRDIRDAAREEIVNLIDRLVNEYLAGDFVEGLGRPGLLALTRRYSTRATSFWPSTRTPSTARTPTLRLQEEALAQYDRREEELGEELMRALERFLLLQIIDQRWREHLHDMDYLREGIHLRSAAQMDPLVSYKNEAFTLFGDLMNIVWGDFARMIYHVQVTVNEEPDGVAPAPRRPSAAASSATGGGRVSYSGGTGVATGAQAMAAAAAGAALEEPEAAGGGIPGVVPDAPAVVVEQRRTGDEPGRNDPCWCGSGKKYKKCHGA